MGIKTTLSVLVVSGIMLAGCAGAPKAPEFKPISASFSDTKWDGKTVPDDEVCNKFNKRPGNTPSISLNNISPTTTKIVLSFNDESAGIEFNNGGHGVLEYTLPETGKSSITIPSAPGQVDKLPKGFAIKRNFTSKAWDTGSGYLAPCSGGRGNTYSVNIEAYNQKGELTGNTKIGLGRY